uniref:hypothetical protein n=1 Tax=Porodaedalea mongolica TaxID=2651638 RepID=UPI0021ABB1A6|nr:hypothetical protein NYK79_mgp17 [Porodaedalea mongolica]UUA03973.1 hypothetical protein [Porodaedalea mongolica]WCF76740.1 hypothetical protein [Porodaedalea mongolica]
MFPRRGLPTSVSNFLTKPYVRIFRVVGGLAILLVLYKNKLGLNLNYYAELMLHLIALLQFLQITIVGIIKIIYGIRKLIKNPEEFEIRNSPVNQLGSITSKLLVCWKMGCQVGGSTVGVLGGSAVRDQFLVAAGHDKVFEPVISSAINKATGSKQMPDPSQEATGLFKQIKKGKENADQMQQFSKELNHTDLEKYGFTPPAPLGEG